MGDADTTTRLVLLAAIVAIWALVAGAKAQYIYGDLRCMVAQCRIEVSE